MRRSILFLSLLLPCSAMAAEDFKEDFSSFSGSYSNVAQVTLPTGIWTVLGVGANTSNGNTSVKFNSSNSYLITPVLSQPQKVSFAYRSGGSNKPVTVSYTLDGGATWAELDRFTITSSSSSFASYSKRTGLDSVANVQFRVSCSASNVYVDDFSVKFYDPDHAVTGDPDDSTYVVEGVPIPTRPFTEPLHTYYIAPDGDDTAGDGSFEKPWMNLQKAVNEAVAGDHIVCRGGTYHFTWRDSSNKLTVRLTKSGTAEAPITIRSYEDEVPVFDFEQQLREKSVGDRGMLITGDYWVLFGLHITHAADNGIKLEGSHNRIERCVFSYNLDTGLQLGFGHKFSDSGHGSSNNGEFCAYNDVIDCDSHHNCDFDSNYGSDADGFACKMHNGKGNRFIRCRAWRNSDDAWDLYETDYSVVIAECWAWESGNPEDHLWVKDYLSGSTSFSGNGNGIKLGGNGTGGSSKGIHYVYNCIAFGCDRSGSVKGFDCNHHKDGHVLIGCLAFDNGYDYMFESGGSEANTSFYNNVCLGRQEICVGTDDYNAIVSPMSKNGWTRNLVTGFSKDDYVSLDEDDALQPRSIDGSLPRRFGRLFSDSRLVDAGNAAYGIPDDLLADFPFLKQEVTGTARDLGPYERKTAVSAIEALDASAPSGTFLRVNLFGQPCAEGYRGFLVRDGRIILQR